MDIRQGIALRIMQHLIGLRQSDTDGTEGRAPRFGPLDKLRDIEAHLPHLNRLKLLDFTVEHVRTEGSARRAFLLEKGENDRPFRLPHRPIAPRHIGEDIDDREMRAQGCLDGSAPCVIDPSARLCRTWYQDFPGLEFDEFGHSVPAELAGIVRFQAMPIKVIVGRTIHRNAPRAFDTRRIRVAHPYEIMPVEPRRLQVRQRLAKRMILLALAFGVSAHSIVLCPPRLLSASPPEPHQRQDEGQPLGQHPDR